MFTSNKELLPSLIFVAFCCSIPEVFVPLLETMIFAMVLCRDVSNYVAYSDNIKLVDNFGVFVLCLTDNDSRKLLGFLSKHCPKIGPSLNGLKWGLP